MNPVLQKLDQVYACPGGIPLRYDLFHPADSEGVSPLVVAIHGGGWISGSKEDAHPYVGPLLDSGFAVACPQYRLAPLHSFPAQVEDILAFVTHARAEASNLRIDPSKFAAIGNSAGGHLAAMAGLSKYGDSRVQAVVDICGISDLTDPHGQHYPVSLGFLTQFMGAPYEGHEEDYRAASPLHQVQSGAPPFLLIHGQADDVVPHGQSVALSKALESVGSKADLHLLDGEGHSFSMDAWEKIEALFVRFLRAQLLAPASEAVSL